MSVSCDGRTRCVVNVENRQVTTRQGDVFDLPGTDSAITIGSVTGTTTSLSAHHL